MRKMLLILFLFYTAISFGQTASKTKDEFLPFDKSFLDSNKSETSSPFQFRIPTLFNFPGNDRLNLRNSLPVNPTLKLPVFSNNKFSPTYNLEGNSTNIL